MAATRIRYGDSELELEKSDRYIAVRPTGGMERQFAAALASAQPTRQLQNTLGGFVILDVEQSPQSMEETLNALRARPSVAAGTHVYHTSADDVPFVPTGQLFVAFKAGTTPEQCQKLLADQQLQIVEAHSDRELVVQVTPESANPIKAAAALQDSPLVEIAEPDLASPGKLSAFALPQDTLLGHQWHLKNVGNHRGTTVGFKAGADARVIAAWERAESLGTATVVVAVIDDGFDLDHPDLGGAGKIVAPRDFTRNGTNPVPDVTIGDWHGTACAGVAVGSANGVGIVGAAPGCRLMPVRWGIDLSDLQVERWFGYVTQQGASVVSCSWSARARKFPLSTRKLRAIARCAREGRGGLGCVVCFAAGNENRDIDSPATGSINGFAIHPDVIAVAASTSMDQRSNYSNFGAAISICAPSSGAGGWGITTSDVTGTFAFGQQVFESGYSAGAYTDEFGGTSSSCPLVAGICALLLSIRPELTAVEVRELLQSTARKIGPANEYDAQGHSRKFGHGCVDAAAAVAQLAGNQPAPATAQPVRRSPRQGRGTRRPASP